MKWQPLFEFGVYSLVGLLSFMLWWAIYEWVITRNHSIREAIFGRQPNTAVALDVFGGLMAIGLLNYMVISGPALKSFWLDLEATGLSLLGTLLLLAVLRLMIGDSCGSGSATGATPTGKSSPSTTSCSASAIWPRGCFPHRFIWCWCSG